MKLNNLHQRVEWRSIYAKSGDRIFLMLFAAVTIYVLTPLVFETPVTWKWRGISFLEAAMYGLIVTAFQLMVVLTVIGILKFPQQVSLRIRATGIAWQGVTKWYHVPWKAMSSIEIAPGGFAFGTPYGRVVIAANQCDWPRAILLVRAHARAPAIILDCGVEASNN